MMKILLPGLPPSKKNSRFIFRSCNKGLGFFFDNTRNLKAAIKYLENYSSNSPAVQKKF